MKKKFLSLLLLPLVLTSCGSKGLSFAEIKQKVDSLSSELKYPYYRVIGTLDFNNEVIEVDATFDKTPSNETLVPYARYNEGFKNSKLDKTDNVVLYGLSSRSYWLRAPLRITKDNFYVVDENGEENKTCAHYIIEHIITSYQGEKGAINPPSSVMTYELAGDEGFAFVGNNVHTQCNIDNYPYYPDPAAHPELDPDGIGWDEENPLPCFDNRINAKVNVRLEYNKDGWLIKEQLSSIDYNYNVSSASQVALAAVYSYTFGS